MIKVIIAGCRNFTNYQLLKKAINRIRHYKLNDEKLIIFSGKASGTDTLGEKYAKEYNFEIKEFPALWDKLDLEPCVIKINNYGKPYNCIAGFNRNEKMAQEADMLIAFWDMKSHGTKNMIELARKYNLKIFIIDINEKKIKEM